MAAAVGLDGFQKWFKTDKVTIDNWLFRLHHQFSFAILFVGLIFIFVENHMNGKAITCKNDDDYSNKFCWIHGTGHVAKQLEGVVTKCITDQTEYTGAKNEPTITYYLWLPFLLVCLMGLAKLSRTLWKSLEGGLLESIIKSQDKEKVGREFLKKSRERNQVKYRAFHIKFFFCELLNVAAVLVSMSICDHLFNGKFWSYGTDVFEYMKKDPDTISTYSLPDPKCNIFPTEVSCDVKSGAITGTADSKNLLCILSNNIFNQHYFFFVWIWWVVLLAISGIALVFRVARIAIPGFSTRVFRFRHGNLSVVNTMRGLTGADFFILDRIAENLDLVNLDELLKYIADQLDRDSGNHMGLVSLEEKGKDKDTENLFVDNA